jgi:leucine dehydrogenase
MRTLKNIDYLIEKAYKNTITKPEDIQKNVLEHENILYIKDKQTGLNAIIAVHDTTLGPAIGNVVVKKYSKINQAFEDVVKLSRSATYKAAIVGLSIGGAHAVVIENKDEKVQPNQLKKLGEYINLLNGKFIATPSSTISIEDFNYIKETTLHTVNFQSKSLNLSTLTAYGVIQGIKASAFYLWNTEDLNRRKIVVQGVGNVGAQIVEFLVKEGAEIIISDKDVSKVEDLLTKFPQLNAIEPEDVITYEADILIPAAVGGLINEFTIPLLSYKLIAGPADNQLKNEKTDGNLLEEKGILFTPDFLLNSGSLITNFFEYVQADKECLQSKIENIYINTLETFFYAKQHHISPIAAAKQLVKTYLDIVQIRKN